MINYKIQWKKLMKTYQEECQGNQQPTDKDASAPYITSFFVTIVGSWIQS